jgi:hypothetical protein
VGASDQLPSWLVWMASLCGVGLLLLGSVALRSGIVQRYARLLAQRQAGVEEEGLQQPLLVSLDEEGSVGSIDTEGEVGAGRAHRHPPCSASPMVHIACSARQVPCAPWLQALGEGGGERGMTGRGPRS